MRELKEILEKQRSHFKKQILHTSLNDRILKIKKIRDWIKTNEQYIIETCIKDYHKPFSELQTTEIKPVLNHISFTLKNIKKWTSHRSVWTPINLLGTRSKIYHEPKGVCLIISPWNYPFNLTLNPLVSAIAAGNCVVLKPSEFTSNTSKLIEELITSIFPPEEVTVVHGDAEVGSNLIKLKFDHIFFTGSPEIGKAVMSSASQNLSSITLELGGKNHTVVDETANIKDSVEKIIWSKYVNCGQTCIAVNHVFVHVSCYDVFILELEKVLGKFFVNNSDYSSVVNNKHIERLQMILNQCLEEGGKVILSSPKNNQKNSFPLTVLADVVKENSILKTEIFGPILPVVKYDNFDTLLDFINEGEKSLALYLFSKSRKNITKFLNLTSSGTVVVNDCMLQYANPYLPFGGVNNSGVGKSGGKSGFLEFTNKKSVLFQKSGFSIAKIIYPPYTVFKEKLAKFLG